MKKVLTGLLAAAILWLGACAAPAPTGTTGRLNILVTDPTLSRTLVPDVTGVVVKYHAVLSRSGSADLTVDFTGTSGSFTAVPVGTWTLKLDGLNAASQVVASGSVQTSIDAVGPNNAAVTLAFLTTGAGSLSITLQWNDTALIDSVTATLDGAALAVPAFTSPAAGKKQVVLAKAGVTSGSPLLNINFNRQVGGSPKSVGNILEAVHIYQNITTAKTLVLADSDFNAAPAVPTGLTVSVAGNGLQLSWTDNSAMEESWTVLRSTSAAGNYTAVASGLPSNTVTYTDANLTAGTTWYYKVAAVNSYGSSESGVASGTTVKTGIGDQHPVTGAFSPVDINGATAGTGWASATWAPGGNLAGGDLEVAVYSKNATKMLLEIYNKATGENAVYDYWMEKGSDNFWRAKLSTVPAGTLYAFRAWGPNWTFDPAWTRGNSSVGFVIDVDTAGNRFNPNKVLYDPYTKEMSHDRETPEMYLAGLDGNIYATGPGLYKTLPRRVYDSGLWAPKSVVIQDSTNFGTKPVIAQKDAIIYEAHVRGLTRHPSAAKLSTLLSGASGFETLASVPDAYRGTYKGAGYMAKYLKGLGYNTIELLPVHDFANDTQSDNKPLGNYWGYMTYGYFAPDRHYAFDKSLGGPTREFKEMVKAFHDEGIEVYLDVVYNHTGEGGLWNGDSNITELTSFRGLDNSEYYQLVKKVGFENLGLISYQENTGCGNNFLAGHTPGRKLILDSLTYWLDTMGVDGFRFDLAPELGREGNYPQDGGNLITKTENGTTYKWYEEFYYSIQAKTLTDIVALANAKNAEVIAEAWDIGAYEVGNFPAGWADWNGRYRDGIRKFIKGDTSGSDGTYWTDFFYGDYSHYNDQGGPSKTINMINAHDGFTLADIVSYGTKTNTVRKWPFGPSDGGEDNNNSSDWGSDQAKRRQVIRNFLTFQMMSRGIPMHVYGDELGRTQNGNNNPYNIDSVATWNNYDMIATNSPQAVATGDTSGGTEIYHNNLGTDAKADGKNNLFFFVKFLNGLRAGHPALRSAAYSSAAFSYFNPTGGNISGSSDKAGLIRIDGTALGDDDFAVLVNMAPNDIVFTVPAADAGSSWKRVVDTGSWAESEAASATGNVWPAAGAYTVTNSYTVKAQSIVVLQGVK